MNHSSLPAVKARLIAVLQARTNLQGVQVTEGYPGADRLERQTIFVHLAPLVQHERSMTGPARASRKEMFRLMLYCYAQPAGATATEALEAAYALAAEVEDQLAEGPMLGGTITGFHGVTVQELHEYEWGVTSEGWRATIEVQLQGWAVLN